MTATIINTALPQPTPTPILCSLFKSCAAGLPPLTGGVLGSAGGLVVDETVGVGDLVEIDLVLLEVMSITMVVCAVPQENDVAAPEPHT